MKSLFLTLLIAYFSFLISSCQQEDKHYVIGVSQCSADIWREKQNAELRMGAYLQNNVELRFAAAYDSDERQIEQIDSLVATGIDLLIVAPNQVQTISPAIDRAYDKGIPVIVFERKTNSQKYTAFISADNYEMGRVMGEYIASQLHGKGRVMEIMGLEGSSPAIERHNGFADALKAHPDIQVVATLQGDWTEASAVKAVKWFRKAAERGIPEACYALGGMYYDGRGVSQDYEESFRWWLKAAEKGMAEAQNDVASLYRGGTGVQQDDEKARMWYLKAAEQDDPLAENSLGEMCMKAPGGPDYAGALRWYRRAAEHGCAMAERNIGRMYYEGLGVKKSVSEAAGWIRKAAEHGHAESQFNLGSMYIAGHGVRQDYMEGLKWVGEAAAQGYERAEELLRLVAQGLK